MTESAEPLDEAMRLVDSEVDRVRAALATVLDADPQIIAAIMAEIESELAERKSRMARLRFLEAQLRPPRMSP